MAGQKLLLERKLIGSVFYSLLKLDLSLGKSVINLSEHVIKSAFIVSSPPTQNAELVAV